MSILTNFLKLVKPEKNDYVDVEEHISNNLDKIDEKMENFNLNKLDKGGYTGTAQNLLTEISKIASKTVLGRMIVGKGLTVDSSGRTSVVSKHDGIIVNDNDIQLNVYDGVDSTSTTRAGSARAVKMAYDKANAAIPKTDIANDLTTGGTDKVLSGQMGKELKKQVDEKFDKAGGKITGKTTLPSNNIRALEFDEYSFTQNNYKSFISSESGWVFLSNKNNTKNKEALLGIKGNLLPYFRYEDNSEYEIITDKNLISKIEQSNNLKKIQCGIYDAQPIAEASTWKIYFSESFTNIPVVIIAPMLGDTTTGTLDGVRVSSVNKGYFEVENQFKNLIAQKIYWVAIEVIK